VTVPLDLFWEIDKEAAQRNLSFSAVAAEMIQQGKAFRKTVKAISEDDPFHAEVMKDARTEGQSSDKAA
jgi:hypothetical protein